MKKLVLVLAAMAALSLSACNDAQVATQHIKTDADNFKINRRITFINTWTGDYIMTVEGNCSQENQGAQLAVICKTPAGQFKRHLVGLSSNVTFMSEQMEYVSASTSHYKIIFKPSVVIPTIEMR